MICSSSITIFLFSLYFSSFNLKYLKLTKIDITRFATKLLCSMVLLHSMNLSFIIAIRMCNLISYTQIKFVYKSNLYLFLTNNFCFLFDKRSDLLVCYLHHFCLQVNVLRYIIDGPLKCRHLKIIHVHVYSYFIVYVTTNISILSVYINCFPSR